MMKALVTAITDPDGSQLTKLLLEKGYEVRSIVCRVPQFHDEGRDHLYHGWQEPLARPFLCSRDAADGSRRVHLLAMVQLDEVYNPAALNQMAASFDEPTCTGLTTGVGSGGRFGPIRETSLGYKYCQPNSWEMSGAPRPPRTEETTLWARSSYGSAKHCGHWITGNCRETYGMFADNGVLFTLDGNW